MIKNILLLNLNWTECKELGAMTPTAISLPLEFAYILSDLKNRNYQVSFIDLWPLNKNFSDIKGQIKESELIVVCSSPSYIFWRDGVIGINFVKENLNLIKQINPSVILVLIGPHGTVWPETLFSKDLDFIIRGEPELIIANLIKTIENNLTYPSGICYKKNNHWVTSDDTIEIQNMDMLPNIRYDLINPDLYPYPRLPYSSPDNNTTALYEASRGCFFQCVFCWRQGFRGKYRQKSLEKIKEELSAIKSKNIEYVYLIDEIFPVDNEWCFEVCRLLREYNIKWGCQVRPEYIANDTVVEAMISAGCRLVQIGLETIDQICYESAKKARIIDLKHLNLNIQKLISRNIAIDLFLVFGLPQDSAQKQLAMARQLKDFPLEKINIIAHQAMPFPKTELWEMGIKEGKALRSWRDIKLFSGLISNQFKDKSQLENSMTKTIAYLKLLKTAKIIKKYFNKTRRISIRDMLKLGFYAAYYTFPCLRKIMRSV